MKLLSLYLPQYHRIKENDKWWGEGYTEWSAVKSAKPYYKKHNQPRVPLNNNYYDLLNQGVETWEWQAKLAKQYGVYGFCIYHYWFLGKQLLEKPMEILLNNPEIDINYCICWANESWTKTWYGLETEVLMKQEYGNIEDWKKHFNYLLPFFNDPRYIKIKNKPMINIYRTFDIDKLDEMINVWNCLAIDNGFDGVYIVSGNTHSKLETRHELIDAYYNFEPGFSLKHKLNYLQSLSYYSKTAILQSINRIFNTQLLERKLDIKNIYKVNWKIDNNINKPVFPGTLPMWDNTPRRKYKGFEYTNSSPKLFAENLKMIKQNLPKDSEIDFVYVNAWNEWGEGAYLEPDEKYKYQYLEAIKSVLKEE